MSAKHAMLHNISPYFVVLDNIFAGLQIMIIMHMPAADTDKIDQSRRS